MQFISRFHAVPFLFNKHVMLAHFSNSLSTIILSLKLAMCYKSLAVLLNLLCDTPGPDTASSPCEWIGDRWKPLVMYDNIYIYVTLHTWDPVHWLTEKVWGGENRGQVKGKKGSVLSRKLCWLQPLLLHWDEDASLLQAQPLPALRSSWETAQGCCPVSFRQQKQALKLEVQVLLDLKYRQMLFFKKCEGKAYTKNSIRTSIPPVE